MQIDATNTGLILRELKDKGAVVIRAYRTEEELTAQLQGALDSGKTGVYAPTRRSSRSYFNARRFALAMRDVLAQLNNYTVLIEPDFYGNMLIMAVTPR